MYYAGMTYETPCTYNLIKSPPLAQSICVRDYGPDVPALTAGEGVPGLGFLFLIRNIWFYLFGRAPARMPDIYADYQIVYAEGEALEAFKQARKTYHLAKLCSEVERRNLTGSRANAQKKDADFSGLDIIDDIFFNGADDTPLQNTILAIIQAGLMNCWRQNGHCKFGVANIGQIQVSLIPP